MRESASLSDRPRYRGCRAGLHRGLTRLGKEGMPRSFFNQSLWLWAILLLGACVRLYGLGERSLSYDECQQFWASQGNVLVSNREITLDPPGFAALLRVHALGGRGEIWLRLLPCLFGVLAIAAHYHLTEVATRSQRAALLAAFLFALAPYPIRYSQSLRVYSEALFLCALLATLFLRSRECETGTSRRTLLILAVLTAGALLTTYGVSWLILMMVIVVLVTATRGQGASSFAPLAALTAGIVVVSPLYLLSLPVQLSQGTPAYFYEDKFMPTESMVSAARFLLQGTLDLFGYFSFIHPLSGVVFGALAVWGMRRLMRDRQGAVVVTLLLGCLALAAGASAFHRFPYGGTRQMLFAAPLFYVCVAAGLDALAGRRRTLLTGGAVALVTLGCATFLVLYHSRPGGQDMRAVTRHLETALQPSDRVLVNKDAIPQFRFYFQGDPERVVWGRETVIRDYVEEINRILSQQTDSRWWLVFSHGWHAGRRSELFAIDPRFRFGATGSFEAYGAAVYLFEPVESPTGVSSREIGP